MLKNLQAQNKPHIYSTKPKLFSSGRFSSLGAEKQRVFKRLFEIRDRYAKNINLPPNSVFPNEQLFVLAEARNGCGDIHFGKRVSERTKQKIVADLEKVLQGGGR